MKKLVMIAGPAGVGKTTVCKTLFSATKNSAWLDADWCWMVNPYPGKTEAQKRYAERAFGYILDGYLEDEGTTHIFFSWLMHGDFMFDLVTDQIKHKNYELHKFVLVCEDAKVFRERKEMDGRIPEQIHEHVDMSAFRRMNAHIIDVSDKTPADVVEEIRQRIEQCEA